MKKKPILTRPPFHGGRLTTDPKTSPERASSSPMNHFKAFMLNTDSLDIMCATEEEEFFYKDTDEPVLEGDPVGLDIENGNEVELVLFANIYWNPEF